MLRAAGRDVRVGGNIGDAVTGLLDGATEETAFVLEVSSFPLEGTEVPPSQGRRVPQSLRRPPRPPRQLRGIRGGQGPDLRQPDRGRLRGGERRRSRGDGAGARHARAASCASATGGEAEAQFVGPEALLWMGGREDDLFNRADVKVPGEHIAMDLLGRRHRRPR